MVYVKKPPPPGDDDQEPRGDRELLTIEQAANYIQVSPSSIRSLIRQGRLRAFRVPGKRKLLIRRSDLLDFLGS